MYTIAYTKQAAKSLRRMPRNIAQLIHKKLERIAIDPYTDHPNAKKLQGREGYRLRGEDWQAIYKMQNEQLSSQLKIFIKVWLLKPPSSAAGTLPRACFCKTYFERLLK